jgi:hypothetical protein
VVGGVAEEGVEVEEVVGAAGDTHWNGATIHIHQVVGKVGRILTKTHRYGRVSSQKIPVVKEDIVCVNRSWNRRGIYFICYPCSVFVKGIVENLCTIRISENCAYTCSQNRRAIIGICVARNNIVKE